MSLVKSRVCSSVWGDSSWGSRETGTQLKLQILLRDWPAVIGRADNKDKAADLTQAVGCGNALCDGSGGTASHHDGFAAELLMKTGLGVVLESVDPAHQEPV